MARLLITQQLIADTNCPIGKHKADVYDTKVTGFIFSVFHTGKKSFYIRFVGDRGKTIQKKIADAEIVQAQEARALAKKLLAQLQVGDNPFQDKLYKRTIPTFAEFIEKSYMPYIKTYKRSWITDVSILKNHLLPVFGNKYLDEVNERDIFKMVGEMMKKYSPATINRNIIMLRYIFNLIIKWNMYKIVVNPTRNVPMQTLNNKRERYLTGEEAEKLIAALHNTRNPMLKYIVPTLILTGARRSEVMNAKWSEFNFESRIWTIPISKSGKARHVPISDGLVRLLKSIPRKNNVDYVFANPHTNKPYVSFHMTWNQARQAVGLPDVRMHDLRHSFASFLVNNGRNLYEVQRILGHANIKTTERYAHLSQASLLSAVNEITKAVQSLGIDHVNNRFTLIPIK